jgi:hypothetical protein
MDFRLVSFFSLLLTWIGLSLVYLLFCFLDRFLRVRSCCLLRIGVVRLRLIFIGRIRRVIFVFARYSSTKPVTKLKSKSAFYLSTL